MFTKNLLKNAYKQLPNLNRNSIRSHSTTKFKSQSILSKFRTNENSIVNSAFGYSHTNQKEKKIAWNLLVNRAIQDVNDLLSQVHHFANESKGIESNNSLLNSFLNGTTNI